MGQKVHPYGFRIGINKPWRSRWFVSRDYDKLLVEDVHLNGKLTLGENTADNGGVRIAYEALKDDLKGKDEKKIDDLTPEQRFFLGFGQVWCQNQTEQAARLQAKTNPHSTGEWRTNGSVQNFDAFGKAFGCKVGQPMMPANACRVW